MSAGRLGIAGVGDGAMIGACGSAVVFAARTVEGIEVAVKLLRISATDDRSRKQFQREADAIERLSAHELIVPILGSGTSDRGEPYLLMQVKGVICRELISKGFDRGRSQVERSRIENFQHLCLFDRPLGIRI